MKNSELFLNNPMTDRPVTDRSNWESASETLAHTTGATNVFRPQIMAGQPNPNTQAVWRSNHSPAKRPNETTPLAKLVRDRLAAMGIRQSEFCRMYRFDQGLLSKIQNSVITNLSLESVLRLSVGLAVPPTEILALIDRPDLHDLVLQAYGREFPAAATANS